MTEWGHPFDKKEGCEPAKERSSSKGRASVAVTADAIGVRLLLEEYSGLCCEEVGSPPHTRGQGTKDQGGAAS